MRDRQQPLPGTGGRVRYGRRAAVSSLVPAVRDSTLPLQWGTVVDPADVILRVHIPGEPIPKGRARSTLARLVGTGRVLMGKIVAGSGDLRLIQGHMYTPQQTEDAETVLRDVFRATRKITEPTPHNVGVLALFQTTHRRADGDNLFKLVGDAMNGTILVDDQQIVEHHVHLLRRCTLGATDLLVWSTQRRLPGG